MLGTFMVKGKKKLICACKDSATDGKRLFDFCSIKNTILDSDSSGSGTELTDIMDTIEKQGYVSSVILRRHFWDMFIVDALLGNFDRHNGNLGFLYNDYTSVTEIAPVFDCGSCLLPQADDQVMKRVHGNESELHARVFQFPTSAIKRNGRKINYYDFLNGTENEDVNEALRRIVPRINIEQVESFIEQVHGISDLQKMFYKQYINARYELMIRPAWKLAATMESKATQTEK